MNKILIDTNAYVSFLTGDEYVLEFLANADRVYLSAFVAGELYAGFRGGRKFRSNKFLLDKFLKKPSVEFLEASHTTADIFGQLKDVQKKTGKPLPINDLWIAAHAVETGSVLITYDKHFEKVPGLRLWHYFPD